MSDFEKFIPEWGNIDGENNETEHPFVDVDKKKMEELQFQFFY